MGYNIRRPEVDEGCDEMYRIWVTAEHLGYRPPNEEVREHAGSCAKCLKNGNTEMLSSIEQLRDMQEDLKFLRKREQALLDLVERWTTMDIPTYRSAAEQLAYVIISGKLPVHMEPNRDNT